jgi:hypothetical protein
MPRVGIEPTIPVFERAKTFHALDLSATVISYYLLIISFDVVQSDLLAGSLL